MSEGLCVSVRRKGRGQRERKHEGKRQTNDPACAALLRCLLGFVCFCIFFFTHTRTHTHTHTHIHTQVLVESCNFTSATGEGVGLGVYQFVDSVKVVGCHFSGLQRCFYLSVSTDNVWLQDSSFSGCSSYGVQGANMPDRVVMGSNVFAGRYRSHNVTVLRCRFEDNGSGLQLGAVQGVIIDNCTFARHTTNALVLHTGPLPANASCRGVTVSDTLFVDNNQEDSVHLLHPDVLVRSVFVVLPACVPARWLPVCSRYSCAQPSSASPGRSWVRSRVTLAWW